MDRHVAVNKEKMEILRKKKEVAGRAANKRFPEEDLDLAMKMKLNDPSAAATMLLEMGRCENNTLDKRTGHSTRMQVREALQTTEFDEEAALWYLKNRDPPDADVKQTTRNVKVMNAKYDYISQRLGTASGLGYPTRMEVERLLVTHRGEEGKVMAALKRECVDPHRTRATSHPRSFQTRAPGHHLSLHLPPISLPLLSLYLGLWCSPL